MTWRQIKPEYFRLGKELQFTKAIASLEHLGSDSQPDGGKAHIISDDHCYVLCIECFAGEIVGGEITTEFKTTPWWFWEAVQALKELPHPDEALDLIGVECADGSIKHISVDDAV